MTHAQLKANALRWANRQRKKQGLEPLKELPAGWPCYSRSCPLGKATGYVIHGRWYLRSDASEQEWLPKRVAEFVLAVDHDKYPELIKFT